MKVFSTWRVTHGPGSVWLGKVSLGDDAITAAETLAPRAVVGGQSHGFFWAERLINATAMNSALVGTFRYLMVANVLQNLISLSQPLHMLYSSNVARFAKSKSQ